MAADARVGAMTFTTRGRFVGDQMLAAWREGYSSDELVALFRDLAGPEAADVERPLLKQCVAITLASAGVDVYLINSWLRT